MWRTPASADGASTSLSRSSPVAIVLAQDFIRAARSTRRDSAVVLAEQSSGWGSATRSSPVGPLRARGGSDDCALLRTRLDAAAAGLHRRPDPRGSPPTCWPAP